MAMNYVGDDGIDIVFQNNQRPYYNIVTYGGDDEISLTLTDTFVNAGGGADTVESDVEGWNDIKLGTGNDTYTGTGFSSVGKRYDIIDAGSGNDTLNIETSHSEYYGGNGRDLFNSVGYNNLLIGGKGVDTISYALQDDDSFLSGRGVYVNLEQEYSTTGAAREEELINFENIVGTSYADTLIGAEEDNRIEGGGGRDIVDGLEGDDTLFGGDGSDDIYGGAGDDRLEGGDGTDILVGGIGEDMFVFKAVGDSAVGANRDVISDFDNNDVIDLSAIDAISGGSDDAFTFIGDDTFSGTAGELRYNGKVLMGDVDGDGNADFEIKINNVASLQNSDFNL